MATIKSNSTPMSSDPRERRAIDDNGPIFDTATNVPIEFSVKTRRNQAAVNRRITGSARFGSLVDQSGPDWMATPTGFEPVLPA